MPLTLILNTKLIKRESKIGYSQDSIWDHLEWELGKITTAQCSTTNGESIKVLYTHPSSHEITLETFYFLEIVKVLSNPNPIKA